jgi:hypothetical protein
MHSWRSVVARAIAVACISIFLQTSVSSSQTVLRVNGVSGASEVDDAEHGLMEVEVRCLNISGGVDGTAFRIVQSPGFTGVLVAEEYPASVIPVSGNVTDGVILSFSGGCAGTEPFLAAKLTYQVFGTSEMCSYLTALAHPNFETAVVFPCGSGSSEAIVETLWVNYDHFAGCSLSVPVAETTWGAVKALFR